MFFYNKILLFCSERLVVNTLEVFAFRGFLDDGVGIPYYIWGVECLFNPRCSAFARVMLVGNGKLPTFSK